MREAGGVESYEGKIGVRKACEGDKKGVCEGDKGVCETV